MPGETAQTKRSTATARAPRMAPEARREQLVMAAMRTFAERGIGASNRSALASEAGVAVPTVFHYFDSQEALIEAVLAELSRFLIDDLLLANDRPELGAADCIENILMAFYDAIETRPDYIRVWLEWSVSVREGLWEIYLDFYRKALQGIRNVLNRGVAAGTVKTNIDLDAATRMIVGLAHVIVQMKYSGSSRKQIVNTIHSILDGFLVEPFDNRDPG